MSRIDLMIGGMQKGGTTSLARYLEKHPGIQTHPQLEMSFFYDEKEYSLGWEAAIKKYFFECDFRSSKLLLAKQATLIDSEEALQRLINHNPDVRMLIILRNPVDRAWSSFLMEVGYGEPVHTFSEAAAKVLLSGKIDENDWRQRIFFGLGLYINFIKLVYKFIPPDQVKIIVLEELQENPEYVLGDVFTWLGLNFDDYDFSVTDKKTNAYFAPKSPLLTFLVRSILKNDNPFKVLLKKLMHPKLQLRLGEGLRNVNKKTAHPPTLNTELRAQLNKFYAPFNLQLANLLNKEFNSWNK